MVKDNSKSFWTTLPGILSGIAGIIVAITGVLSLSGILATHPPANITSPSEHPIFHQQAAVAQIRGAQDQQFVPIGPTVGMIIHIDFTVHGMQGKPVDVQAYFLSPLGTPLPSQIPMFATPNGQLTTGKIVYPTSNDSEYENLELPIPYAAFSALEHGIYNLGFNIGIWDVSSNPPKEIAELHGNHFLFSNKK